MGAVVSRTRVALGFMTVVMLLGCSKKTPTTGQDSSDYPSVPEAKLQGIARTNLDSPTPTNAQLERKRRSEKAVKELGLPVLDSLPVVEDDAKVTPRTTDEVAARCIATTLTAVKGKRCTEPTS